MKINLKICGVLKERVLIYPLFRLVIRPMSFPLKCSMRILIRI